MYIWFRDAYVVALTVFETQESPGAVAFFLSTYFGFILALTDRGLYIVSQPLLGPPTDIEGPIPASTIEASTRRKILSYLVTLSGGADLRLRVAAGSQLNQFLDELASNRG